MNRCGAIGIVAVLVAGCGSTDIAATAGEHVLTTRRLAELVGPARPISLEEDAVYNVALRWVEYSVVGDSAAHGVDLMDSLLILKVMWPDVERAVVDSFRLAMSVDSIELDSADVLAMYSGDEFRRVSHLLFEPLGDAEARRRASSARRRLLNGEPWEILNELNDDDVARAANGSLGVVTRGATVKPFEDVAFALEPGAISDLVETEYGYHVIRRPALEEVWGDLANALRQQRLRGFDERYKDQLTERRNVRLVDNAVSIARAALERPLEAKRDETILARFDTGTFTVARYASWMLHVLDPRFQRDLDRADDDTVRRFVTDLVLQDLMYEEALEVGVTIPTVAWSLVREKHDEQMALLRTLTGLWVDSLATMGETAAERRESAQQLIDTYLVIGLRLAPRFFATPPILADTLLHGTNWSISRRAVRRAIELAQPSRDSVLVAPPGPVVPESVR